MGAVLLQFCDARTEKLCEVTITINKSLAKLQKQCCLNTLYLPVGQAVRRLSLSGSLRLRFKSQVGQVEHIVTNGSPPLQHFFESSCVAQAQ